MPSIIALFYNQLCITLFTSLCYGSERVNGIIVYPTGEEQTGVNGLGYVDFLPRCVKPAANKIQEPEYEDFRYSIFIILF